MKTAIAAVACAIMPPAQAIGVSDWVLIAQEHGSAYGHTYGIEALTTMAAQAKGMAVRRITPPDSTEIEALLGVATEAKLDDCGVWIKVAWFGAAKPDDIQFITPAGVGAYGPGRIIVDYVLQELVASDYSAFPHATRL